jgi:hypothetical protein
MKKNKSKTIKSKCRICGSGEDLRFGVCYKCATKADKKRKK